MSSIAICAFCSKYALSVQVICEGKCLICSKCQVVPSIRKLFIDTYFSASLENNSLGNSFLNNSSFVNNESSLLDVSTKGGGGASGARGGCPICSSTLARNMVQTIMIYNKQSKQTEDLTVSCIGDLDYNLRANEFIAFIRRFRQNYDELYRAGILRDEEHNEDITISNSNDNDRVPRVGAVMSRNNSRPGTMNLPSRPETNTSRRPDSNQGTKQMKKDIKVSDYLIGPSKLLPFEAFEFGIDCICAQYLSILRHATESFITVAMKLCSKKKYSQKTNDYKAKSITDFYTDPCNIALPSLLLFGRCLGLYPRKLDTIRPTYGIILTIVYILASSDKHLKTGNILKADMQINIDEFKQKFVVKGDKKVKEKYIPLRRALKVLEIMTENKDDQAHWNMSSLSAGCMEYETVLPWSKESKAKLLHLLMYSIGEGDTIESLIEIKTSKSYTNAQLIRAKTLMSLPASSKSNRSTILASSPKSNNGSSRNLSDKIDKIENSHNIVSTSSSTTNIPQIIPHSDVNIQRFQNLSLKATQIWNSKIVPILNETALSEELILNKVMNVGRVIDDKISCISFENMFPHVGSHLISLSELSMVCIEAWEAEYTMVNANAKRSVVTRERKNAVSGTFDRDIAELDQTESISLTRIINWCHSNNQELDWDDIKFNALNKVFPFYVPLSLVNKTNPELNYHYNELHKKKEDRQFKEIIEDLTYSDGPYSHHFLQNLIDEGEGAFGLRTNSHDSILNILTSNKSLSNSDFTHQPIGIPDYQRDAISRGQYLASQTIGHEKKKPALFTATSRLTTPSNPSVYPILSAVPLPLSMSQTASIDDVYRSLSPLKPKSKNSVDSTNISFCSDVLENDKINVIVNSETQGDGEDLIVDGDSRPTLLSYIQGYVDTLGDIDDNVHQVMSAEEGHFLRDASHVMAASKLLSQESNDILEKRIIQQNTAGFLHNYVSPSITNFPEIEKNTKKLHGNSDLMQQSLSKIPYFSSVPGRNMVSIVDLIDLENSKVTPLNNDGAKIFSKVNLLSTSNSSLSQKIDDDLFGFKNTVKFGFKPDHNSLRVSTTPINFRSNHKSFRDEHFTNNQKQRTLSPLSAAKSRIQFRSINTSSDNTFHISDKKTSYTEVNNSNQLVFSVVRGFSTHPKLGPWNEDGGIKNLLVINEYTKCLTSMESERSKELEAEALSLNNMAVSTELFKAVANSYLKEKQLESIRKLDFSNINLTVSAAEYLAEKLSLKCNLIHLNLGNII